VAAVLGAATLAACTGSSGTRHDAAGPTSRAAAPTPSSPVSAPPTFSGTQHRLPTGAATKNNPQLYKNVSLTGCSATAHGWKGTGTATNTTSRAIDYSVLVLFTDAQARDIDSATATIRVPARTSAHWTAARKFAAPKNVQCVIRAVHRA
jgi:hypothetical protein